MSKAKSVIEFYKNVLNSLSVVPTEDGLLSVRFINVFTTTDIPCTLGEHKHRLALPTDENLRKGFGSITSTVGFHPISEVLLHGESDVIKYLKKMVLFRLNAVTLTLTNVLASIAADAESHAGLNAKQSEFLTLLPSVKQDFIESTDSLVKKATQGKCSPLNIYLKRDDTVAGSSYTRVARVNSPLLKEVSKDDNSIAGVMFKSKKSKENFLALFKYILPKIDEVDTYTGYTDAKVAPYFVALMKAYANVANRLNQLVTLFSTQLPNPDELLIDLSWMQSLGEIDSWRDVIPPLAGNEGNVEKTATGSAPARVAPVTLAPPAHLNVPSHQPTVEPTVAPRNAPATEPSSDAVDWSAFSRAVNPQPTIAPGAYNPYQALPAQQPVVNQYAPANVHPSQMGYNYNPYQANMVQPQYNQQMYQPAQQSMMGYQQPQPQNTFKY